MLYIFDILGAHCGMHYYDKAFAEVLKERGYDCQVYSNYEDGNGYVKYFPNFFNCSRMYGILRFFVSYIRFFLFMATHKKDKVVYLTFGELYELPFLLSVSLSENGWVDIHEVHALKYKDLSKVSKLFEWIYHHLIHHVIYHSERTYNMLKCDRLDMVYVPHFKYVFQKDYNESKLGNDVKEAFRSNTSKFLFFGNLSTVKGIDTIIEVFSDIGNEDYELVVAGKNVENIDFSQFRSEKIKVFDRHINDDELVYLYSHTDYILLPYKKSSQSGIFAMAAYFHKPMILSDIPYFKQMIEEYPSFGVIASLTSYKDVILDVIKGKFPKRNYTREDCERFEMKKDVDRFVDRLLQEVK